MSVVLTPRAPMPVGAYSQGKQVGPFLQVSGQLAVDPVSGQIAGDIAAQTRRALEYVSNVLAAAGASWTDVLVARVYLADDDDFAAFDAAYREVVPEPFPARVTTGAQLAPGALVEIDALAVAPTQEAANR